MTTRGFQQIYSDQIRLTLILLFSTDLSRLTQIKAVGIPNPDHPCQFNFFLPIKFFLSTSLICFQLISFFP